MKKNKLYLVLGLIVIIIIIIGGIIIKDKKVESIEDNEFRVYSLDKSKIKDTKANLIFMKDIDGSGQEERVVKKGDKYSFKIHGNDYEVEILKITDEYMTISIEGLAPTKQNGSFSLIKDYDKITIKRNTGVSLNAQATDLIDGEVYIYYNK